MGEDPIILTDISVISGFDSVDLGEVFVGGIGVDGVDRTDDAIIEIPGLIAGSNLSNTLTGTFGKDTIKGFGGNDTLNGLDGDDVLQGGRMTTSLTAEGDLIFSTAGRVSTASTAAPTPTRSLAGRTTIP